MPTVLPTTKLFSLNHSTDSAIGYPSKHSQIPFICDKFSINTPGWYTRPLKLYPRASPSPVCSSFLTQVPYLGQFCSPEGIWHHLETFLAVTTWERSAILRNIQKCIGQPLPTAKNYPVQTIGRTKVRNPALTNSTTLDNWWFFKHCMFPLCNFFPLFLHKTFTEHLPCVPIMCETRSLISRWQLPTFVPFQCKNVRRHFPP